MKLRNLLSNSPQRAKARRPVPSSREFRAVELGADQLVDLLEWTLRGRSQALRSLRTQYRTYCLRLYARLQRAERQSGIRTHQGRAA